MNGNRPQRLRRRAAEQLLDGTPGGPRQGGEPLASVLAAAAAPPRDAEQAGEDAAVTAFLAEHLVPLSHPRRGQMIKSPLAKLLTIKVGAAALAVSAGGMALAATTGAFSPSAHVRVPPATSVSATTGTTTPGTKGGVHASMPGTHTGTPGSGHASTGSLGGILSAVQAGTICRELAGQVTAVVRHTHASAIGVLTETGVQDALDNPALNQVVTDPAFAPLVATAAGNTNVADYCGLVMHLAKLAYPASLVKVPAAVLTAIPASIVTQIPASALSDVPAADLGKLPISFLTKLASSVLSGLPASVLSELPASVLKGLLPSLPAGSVAQLPTHLLAGLLSGMPTGTLPGILSKLPTGIRGQVLMLLPAHVLSQLPASMLSGLPSSILSKLGSL